MTKAVYQKEISMSDLAFRFELTHKIILNDRIISNPQVRREKRGKGYYISFYHDAYRHYARFCIPGTLCFAKRTKDYYCFLNPWGLRRSGIKRSSY